MAKAWTRGKALCEEVHPELGICDLALKCQATQHLLSWDRYASFEGSDGDFTRRTLEVPFIEGLIDDFNDKKWQEDAQITYKLVEFYAFPDPLTWQFCLSTSILLTYTN